MNGCKLWSTRLQDFLSDNTTKSSGDWSEITLASITKVLDELFIQISLSRWRQRKEEIHDKILWFLGSPAWQSPRRGHHPPGCREQGSVDTADGSDLRRGSRHEVGQKQWTCHNQQSRTHLIDGKRRVNLHTRLDHSLLIGLEVKSFGLLDFNAPSMSSIGMITRSPRREEKHTWRYHQWWRHKDRAHGPFVAHSHWVQSCPPHL